MATRIASSELEEPVGLRAMEALGKGLDLSSDFRLKFAKGLGSSGGRLVVLDSRNTRDVTIPGSGVTIRGVSEDIRIDKGDRIRFKSDVLEFNQMSELLNQKSSIQGKVPSGYLNALFEMSGSWFHDVQDTKYLALDGYFISLYNLHLIASPLVLCDEVKRSVPSHWDPAALSRFIESYGTHIIVGMAIGGQDLICVRQTPTSPIPPADLRRHLEDLGDVVYSDSQSPSLLQRKSGDGKHRVPDVFSRILQSNTVQFTSISETSRKDGLTVISAKRGGNVFLHSHTNWLQTVAAKPEALHFKFVPIISLLAGVPGCGYLSHAINLYLRYKPPLADLLYFLEFQVPRQWAPMFCELPLRHQRRKASCPSLQFSFMGSKVNVSSTQISTDQKPVVGLRLYLEGKSNNQLAIHVQHLSSLPGTMTATAPQRNPRPLSRWRGSDEYESSNQFLEPVRWKRYSNICTSAVKHDPDWLTADGDDGGVYIVTGAQLISKGNWPKTVLHLRLLFTFLPGASIQKKEWYAAPESGHKSGFFTNLSTTFSFAAAQQNQHREKGGLDLARQPQAVLNSGVYPEGPPGSGRSARLRRFVDSAEVSRGPHDAPGHWLVIAARLAKDSGKIGLHVKFALLDGKVPE